MIGSPSNMLRSSGGCTHTHTHKMLPSGLYIHDRTPILAVHGMFSIGATIDVLLCGSIVHQLPAQSRTQTRTPAHTHTDGSTDILLTNMHRDIPMCVCVFVWAILEFRFYHCLQICLTLWITGLSRTILVHILARERRKNELLSLLKQINANFFLEK